MTNTVLGFDIRIIDPLVISKLWDRPRRERYLIRSEIGYPLSVDSVVIPSIFEFTEGVGSSSDKIVLPPSDMHQRAFSLWRRFSSMKGVITKQKNVHLAILTMAITSVDKEIHKLDYRWESLLTEPADPNVLDHHEWQLAGYDVADQYLTSGLSNCGLDNEERPLVAGQFQKSINEFGLFSNMNSATAFKAFIDHKIPEHAPFFVFGIYKQHV
jgi:hypothetical protein